MYADCRRHCRKSLVQFDCPFQIVDISIYRDINISVTFILPECNVDADYQLSVADRVFRCKVSSVETSVARYITLYHVC